MLDSARFATTVEVLPSPFTRLTRTVYVTARRGELGTLPLRVDKIAKAFLRESVLPEVQRLAPEIPNLLQVLEEPVSPAASALSAEEC